MRREGLYFHNTLKTPDKVALSSEATRIFEATNPLFEEARQVNHLKPAQIACLDKTIDTKLSKLLDKEINRLPSPSNSPSAKP